MAKLLKIRDHHWQEMVIDVSQQAPTEACGLVAGLENQSVKVYLIENELRSPVCFRMSPRGQIEAFLEIERNGWELMAIYHSHPTGPDHPSERDLIEFAYPDTPYLIWYKKTFEWACRAFLVCEDRFEEISIQIN